MGAKLRAERRAAGLCPLCGNTPEDRFNHCRACRTRALIHTNRWRVKKGLKVSRGPRTMAAISHGHWPPHCECGRGRVVTTRNGISTGGCRLCVELDGFGPAQFELIQVLRASDEPMRLDAISHEMGMTGNTARQLADRMVRSGLLGKRQVPPGWEMKHFGAEYSTEYYLARRR